MTRKREAALWLEWSHRSLLVSTGNSWDYWSVACGLSLLLPTKGSVATGHIWGPFSEMLLQNMLSLKGEVLAVIRLREFCCCLYLMYTLTEAGGTGIVIESLSFKKWLFSWNKAMKFNAFSEITNLKIEVTGGLHLSWFLCRVCAVKSYLNSNMSDDGTHSWAFVVIFIGEAQMFKLKKNCGNIFSKYGLCRVWEMLGLLLMYLLKSLPLRHYTDLVSVIYVYLNDLLCVRYSGNWVHWIKMTIVRNWTIK